MSPVCHEQKERRSRALTYLPPTLVLMGRSTASEKEEQSPGLADLSPHLEVQRLRAQNAGDAGVQHSPHKEVVDMVAGHAMGLFGGESPDIDDDTYDVLRDDGCCHERTEVVEDGGEAPQP